MRTIDLTHIFARDLPVYPGDPEPVIETDADYAVDGFFTCCVTAGMHVGTHMDAPMHMSPGGAAIADYPPHRFFGRGVLVDARGTDEIRPELLSDQDLRTGDIIVVLTGWDARFREPDYFTDFPPVASDFADILVKAGVSLLCLDTPSPDHEPFEVHKLLLGNGVLIVENLTGVAQLLDLPAFEIVALPGKTAWEAAPCRVVARVPSDD